MSSFLPNIIVTQAVRDLGLKTNLDAAATQEKIRAGPRPPLQLPARRRRLGLVADRRQPSFHDRLRGGGTGAGAGRRRRNQGRRDVAKGPPGWPRNSPKIPSWPPICAPTCCMRWRWRGSRMPAALGQVYAKRAKLSPYGLARARPGAGAGQRRARRRDRGRAGAIRAAGRAAGLVARHARRTAGLFRRRDARSHRLRGEVPVAPAAGEPAAAQGGAVADESSQRRLLVVFHQADGHGDLRAHRLSEGLERAEAQSHGDGLRQRQGRADAQVRPGHRPAPRPSWCSTKAKLQPGVESRARDHRRRRAGSTIPRAPSITPPRRSCRKPAAVSLNILRDYFKLVPEKEGDKIVYDTVPLNGPVASGDIMAVRLTVTGLGMEVPDGGRSHSRRHGIHRTRRQSMS